MNNQQAIDRLVKHLECGWTEETVEAIEMGIHALKETQWIPCSEKMPEDNTDVIVCFWKEPKAILKLDGVNITGQCWNMERERCLQERI